MVEISLNSPTVVEPVKQTKGDIKSLVSAEPKAEGNESGDQLTAGGEYLSVEEAVSKLEGLIELSLIESRLSFSIEESAGKTVVQVIEVGSDKLIRQFPPEELINLAKFLEQQDPMAFSEDYLKGLLFDRQI